MHTSVSRLGGRPAWCTLAVVAALGAGVAHAQEEVRIPRVPLADPSPTCHPDPACAGDNEPMASFATTTGGVEGRTGVYTVTAFKLVLVESAHITGLKGVGGDGNEPPDLEDFAPYVNVFSSLDAFAANPLRGDVYQNIPMWLHHSEEFGDNPADRFVHVVPLDAPFFLDVGTYYIALHIDRMAGTFWFNQTTVDIGSDYFATNDLPGAWSTWASTGLDPGTVAIDTYGVLGVVPCAPDIDFSGDVGFSDVLEILRWWGPCPDHCPADLDRDGSVGDGDLQVVLAEWGPCE